jgi:ribosomal protein L18
VAGSSKGGSELWNRTKCREFLDLASQQILPSDRLEVRITNNFFLFDVADDDAGNDVITVEAQIADTT